VIVAGKQSQANKNYWAAYAIWKAKVAEARARRRAAEKARLEALRRAQKPPTAQAPQIVLTPLMRFLLLLGISLLVVLGSGSTTTSGDNRFAKPITVADNTPEESCGGEGAVTPGFTVDMNGCAVGAVILSSAYITYNWWQRTMAQFGTVECWFFGWNCPWHQSSPGITTLPNTQVQPFPQSVPQATAVAIPTAIGIPRTDYSTPEPPDQEDCTHEEMERRIAGRTVAQVIGESDFYPIQNAVTTYLVIQYAVDMCRYGGFGSFPAIQWFKGATRNSIYQGHTRFVASHVAGVRPIFEQEPREDFSEDGIDLEFMSWEEVIWAGRTRW